MSASKTSTLTQERLKEVVTYDPETGDFFWNDHPSRPKQWVTRFGNKKAEGAAHAGGYRLLVIDNVRHLKHRLVWLYVHGLIGPGEVDHINGIRDDNRIVNLRLVSRTLNHQNRSTKSNNRSGILGVHPARHGYNWVATGSKKSRPVHLGSYKTQEEAARVAHEWRIKNHPGYIGR